MWPRWCAGLAQSPARWSPVLDGFEFSRGSAGGRLPRPLCCTVQYCTALYLQRALTVPQVPTKLDATSLFVAPVMFAALFNGASHRTSRHTLHVLLCATYNGNSIPHGIACAASPHMLYYSRSAAVHPITLAPSHLTFPLALSRFILLQSLACSHLLAMTFRLVARHTRPT